MLERVEAKRKSRMLGDGMWVECVSESCKTRGRIARAAPATSQTILHIVLHWGLSGFTHVKSP